MRGLLERKLANSKYRTEKLKQKMTDIFEKTVSSSHSCCHKIYISKLDKAALEWLSK
jgi:hypothetical protein